MRITRPTSPKGSLHSHFDGGGDHRCDRAGEIRDRVSAVQKSSCFGCADPSARAMIWTKQIVRLDLSKRMTRPGAKRHKSLLIYSVIRSAGDDGQAGALSEAALEFIRILPRLGQPMPVLCRATALREASGNLDAHRRLKIRSHIRVLVRADTCR